MRAAGLGLVLFLASGPAHAGGKDSDLRARVEALETEVATLRAEHDELAAIIRKAMPTQQDEEAAAELFGQTVDAMNVGHNEDAMGLLTRIMQDYPATEAGQAAPRFAAELSVVGRPVQMQVTRWIQGEHPSLASGTTLVVFWEAWCPHCQREVPALAAQYERYQAEGVDVVGITRMTRGVTDADVATFLTEHGVSFPIAQEDGTMADEFGVDGIPAAAVVKDGAVVWRGHPGALSPEFVASFLK